MHIHSLLQLLLLDMRVKQSFWSRYTENIWTIMSYTFNYHFPSYPYYIFTFWLHDSINMSWYGMPNFINKNCTTCKQLYCLIWRDKCLHTRLRKNIFVLVYWIKKRKCMLDQVKRLITKYNYWIIVTFKNHRAEWFYSVLITNGN